MNKEEHARKQRKLRKTSSAVVRGNSYKFLSVDYRYGKRRTGVSPVM